jgi:hypothetical protein
MGQESVCGRGILFKMYKMAAVAVLALACANRGARGKKTRLAFLFCAIASPLGKQLCIGLI